MEEKNNDHEKTSVKTNKKKLLLAILIPALIALVVAGIFIFKNAGQGEATRQSTTPSQEASVTIAPTAGAIDYQSAEFDLDATENFDLEKILSYGLPVIIDFGADSCIPCKEMAPILKELNQELRGKVVVKFVDVWKNSDSAQNFPSKVIPTQYFFDKEGKPYVPEDPESSAFNLYTTKDTKEHVFTAHEGGMDKAAIMAVLKEMGVE